MDDVSAGVRVRGYHGSHEWVVDHAEEGHGLPLCEVLGVEFRKLEFVLGEMVENNGIQGGWLRCHRRGDRWSHWRG